LNFIASKGRQQSWIVITYYSGIYLCGGTEEYMKILGIIGLCGGLMNMNKSVATFISLILKWILREVGCEGMDWVELAKHRVKCGLF
jgi:hypothetical protein